MILPIGEAHNLKHIGFKISRIRSGDPQVVQCHIITVWKPNLANV